MLRVALTGNVAAGKSAVAEAWRRRGVPVVSADDLFDAMGSLAANAPLEVTLLRGMEERTVTIPA